MEFPSYAVGGMTLCPHCQKSTRTKADASAPAPQPVVAAAPKSPPPAPVEAKGGGSGVLIGALIAGMLAFGAWWLTQNRAPKKELEEPKVAASKPAAEVPQPATNATAAPPSTPTPATVKNVQDLKFSAVQIQRPKGTRGSKLIYATGSVTNSSNVQRLGVKVEIDLLNDKGEKIDNSSDYRAAMQPGEVWNFRALAHDPAVATGVVARIIEEN